MTRTGYNTWHPGPIRRQLQPRPALLTRRSPRRRRSSVTPTSASAPHAHAALISSIIGRSESSLTHRGERAAP